MADAKPSSFVIAAFQFPNVTHHPWVVNHLLQWTQILENCLLSSLLVTLFVLFAPSGLTMELPNIASTDEPLAPCSTPPIFLNTCQLFFFFLSQSYIGTIHSTIAHCPILVAFVAKWHLDAFCFVAAQEPHHDCCQGSSPQTHSFI